MIATPLPPGMTSRPASGFAELRARPSLWVALLLSIAVHAVWSLWPAEPPASEKEVVLSATLTEMPAPPPPAAVAAAPTPKPKPRLRRPAPPAPAPPADARAAAAADEAQSAAPLAGPATDAPLPEMSTTPLVEALSGGPGPDTLPPRLDLAYKVFLGTQGFLIGEATYRFEHDGRRYRISTVAQARGLAALFVRGRGKVESRGTITPAGLQPEEFAVERGSSDRREVARFDWLAGIVRLHDDKEAALEFPAFDPMTLMWQAYFTPPETPQQALNVVTTRRVYAYTIEREAIEKVAWAKGEIVAERWHRRSNDGRVEAWFWIAPDMHYALVKMRVSATARGTLEAVLDAIRVEEKARSPDEAVVEPNRESPPPGESAGSGTQRGAPGADDDAQPANAIRSPRDWLTPEAYR
jgi:hypothetical protein